MIRLKTGVQKGLLKIKNSNGIYAPAFKKTTTMKSKIVLLLCLIAFFASCVKKPGSYPPEPQIYHLSTRPNVLNLEDTVSAVKIELKFNDGDGDIGLDPDQKKQSIYLRDSRDTSTDKDYTFQYPFPYIPDNMRPSSGGLEGFITVSLGKDYFSVTDSLHLALRKDTMHWNIYIMDDAGHKSNVASSDPIYLEF
jgi:hypothetical protein